MLWQAVTMLQPHMLAEEILPAKEMPWCKALIPPGGRANLRVARRRYFVSRGQMLQQLEHLTTHCVTLWQCRLQCPLHVPPPSDLVSEFYPRPTSGVVPLRSHGGRTTIWCPSACDGDGLAEPAMAAAADGGKARDADPQANHVPCTGHPHVGDA